jgi:hypothetical protein
MQHIHTCPRGGQRASYLRSNTGRSHGESAYRWLYLQNRTIPYVRGSCPMSGSLMDRTVNFVVMSSRSPDTDKETQHVQLTARNSGVYYNNLVQ